MMKREMKTMALAVLVAVGMQMGGAAQAASNTQAAGGGDVAALEKQAAALGDRITRLQDLNEVEIVQDAYGYYVDKGQWRSISDLFTEDATLEIGGKGVFLGRKRVFQYMTEAFGAIGPKEGSLIDHQQFQCLPTVHEDGVTAEARCIAFVMSSGGWGHNYYENTYKKINGVWTPLDTPETFPQVPVQGDAFDLHSEFGDDKLILIT